MSSIACRQNPWWALAPSATSPSCLRLHSISVFDFQAKQILGTVFFVERCASHVQIISEGVKCLTLQSTHHPVAVRPAGPWGWVGCPCQLYQASHPQRVQTRAGISPWISPSTQSSVVPASQGGHGVFLTHFHRKFWFLSPPPVSYFLGSNLVFSLPSIFDVHTHSVCLYLNLNIYTSIPKLLLPTWSLVNTYCGFRQATITETLLFLYELPCPLSLVLPSPKCLCPHRGVPG